MPNSVQIRNYVVTRGDGFKAVKITPVIDTLNQDMSSWSITIQWRRGSDRGPIIRTATIGNGLTLTGSNESVTIDSFIVDWAPGVYVYDVQFDRPGKDPSTWLKGTVTVKPDVTQI